MQIIEEKIAVEDFFVVINETVGIQKSPKIAIFSDFKFLDCQNVDQILEEKISMVDFGRASKMCGEYCSSYINIFDTMADNQSIESVFYQVKSKIVQLYQDDNHFGITSPYMDFSGDGDIVTFGYPIKYNTSIYGVVAIGRSLRKFLF